MEEATETLSQMVARPYLRTPRAKIIQTTQLLHRKQQDFLLALSRGLIPDDDQLPESRSFMPRYSNLFVATGVVQRSIHCFSMALWRGVGEGGTGATNWERRKQDPGE